MPSIRTDEKKKYDEKIMSKRSNNRKRAIKDIVKQTILSTFAITVLYQFGY